MFKTHSKIYLVLLLTLIFFITNLIQINSIQANAEEIKLADVVEKKFYSNGEVDMAYCLYVPQDYDESKTYRLVLFLHGAGDRGYDHEVLLKPNYGFVETLINSDEYKNDTIILIPQCPIPYLWVSDSWATGGYTLKEEPSPALKAAKQLTDSIIDTYSVDKTRVYACGVSMGGMGVWDLLARYPDYFAAAAPVCGAVDESKINEYAKTPIFTCNDLRDNTVGAIPTKNVAEQLQLMGADIVYKIYDTDIRQDPTYHSTWIDAFQLDKSENNLYNFLFSKKRAVTDETPTPIEPETPPQNSSDSNNVKNETPNQNTQLNNLIVKIVTFLSKLFSFLSKLF